MMIRDQKAEFRQHLLAEQAMDPALKAEFERKLNTMFENSLSPFKKIWFMTLMLFCMASGGVALVLAITEATLPPAARSALLMGAVFALAWLIFFAQILKRGTMRRRIDAPMAAGMAFVFSLMMCILLAIGGLPTEQVILTAVLFLFPAGLMVLRTVVEQSEMRMQVQLMELQFRLAELSERLDDGEAGAGVRR